MSTGRFIVNLFFQICFIFFLVLVIKGLVSFTKEVMEAHALILEFKQIVEVVHQNAKINFEL
jgi:hypothetical protein